jgi:hypothetical protein
MLVVWNMGLVHLPFIKLGELYEVWGSESSIY